MAVQRTPSRNSTHLLVMGTLFTVIALTLLLVAYDSFVVGGLRSRTYLAFILVGYTFLAQRALHHGHRTIASWMIIALYAVVALSTLLFWGLNAPVGILTISLVIVLTGLLLGSRYVPYITAAMVGAIALVQLVHSLGFIAPDTSAIRVESSYWDVIGYAVMFFVYSLIAWSSMKRSEIALTRAKKAEEIIRAQNERMSIELERQASQLRQEQLTQTRQLHKFAIIGQSAAAMLHELSSRLSVLNFDLSDLKQQLKNSKTITSAEQSIAYINDMVHQARQQLNTYGTTKRLAPRTLISTVIKDIRLKPAHKGIEVLQTYQKSGTYHLYGDPVAFSQILTILITNACEASLATDHPLVRVLSQQKGATLSIIISDNGPGIPNYQQAKLFTPHVSKKSTGMGVGLYIAKHLTELLFNGSLTYTRDANETHFTLALPLRKKKER